ncbi:MAG: L,D-transpeptidase family protein [Phycisphaeraceae bacterium]|nr:L,D-transpeptidase family protein [Phycisphaeraceae bacterium]
MALGFKSGRSRGRSGRRRNKKGKLPRNLIVLALLAGGGYLTWHFVAGGSGEAAESQTAEADTPAEGSKDRPAVEALALAGSQKPKAGDRTSGVVAKAAVKKTPPPVRTDAALTKQIDAGRMLMRNDQLVEARKQLNAALLSGKLSSADAASVRAELTKINNSLVFGTRVLKNDPHVLVHRVKAGEPIGNAVLRQYDVWWGFISMINKVQANRLQANQPLKIVRGPFHAIVHKRAFRLDLFLGEHPDDPRRMYVASVPVGLGKDDSTPTGLFVVKNRQFNPPWTDPNTGRYYHADDPENPLGDYWVGLTGIDDSTRVLSGYGLHGTVEPQSIGRQASMGCVRMRDDDIGLVYSMMVPKKSKLRIVE